jgi:hypothetical protein
MVVVGLLNLKVANSWHTQGPIEGTRHPQALYLSPGQEVSFTLLRVGWNIAIQVFPIGITRESHLKPPGHDLPRGHLPLSSPMERYLTSLALTYAR